MVGGFDTSISGVGEDMDVEYRIRRKGWLLFGQFSCFFTNDAEVLCYLSGRRDFGMGQEVTKFGGSTIRRYWLFIR